MHTEESPLAGSTVKLRDGLEDLYNHVQVLHILSNHYVEVDDWWDRISGIPWRESQHHLAIDYMGRRQLGNLPDDDQVLLAKIGSTELLIHVTEIDDV